MNRLTPLSALVSLAIMLSGCGDETSTPYSPARIPSPISTPAPAPPPPETPTYYTLSGVVFEVTAAGKVPIEGVQLYCDSCGSPVGHTFVHTDANGFYSLDWARNGGHPLYVEKVGFEIFEPAGMLRDLYGRIMATVNGDTRFDIQLVRR